MPKLLPGSEPPELTSMHGISSVVPFGGDVLSHADLPDPILTRQIRRHRSAVRRMVESDDLDVQIVRASMDARFMIDNAGAPENFAKSYGVGESITALLASLNDVHYMGFCLLNSLRQHQLQNAILEQVPYLHEDGLARADKLHDSGIISNKGRSVLVTAIDDLAVNERIYPLDSFEGGHAAAMADENGIYISHLFNGGFRIGEPTSFFFHAAFHEDEHYARRYGGLKRTGSFRSVEEFLVEHHAVVSASAPDLIKESVLGATAVGSYTSLRRLFGSVLLGPRQVSAEQLGDALTTPEDEVAYQGLIKVLRYNFNNLFPEHDGAAFEAYVIEEEACTFGHQADKVAHDWGAQAASRLLAA